MGNMLAWHAIYPVIHSDLVDHYNACGHDGNDSGGCYRRHSSGDGCTGVMVAVATGVTVAAGVMAGVISEIVACSYTNPFPSLVI